MADIPSDTRIFTTPPVTESPKRKGNRGRHPTKERLAEGYVSPIEVRKLAATLDDTQWTTFSVRETERGQLLAKVAAFRVWHSLDNLPFQEVWLVIRRPLGENGVTRYSFSNAPPDTPLQHLAMMQGRRYWVERALEDANGEAGLDQYQVRGWLAPPHDKDHFSNAVSVATHAFLS